MLTDDDWLYIRATSQHDTAACWRPDRYAVERRPGELFCGQNYRMSELEGAAQLVRWGSGCATTPPCAASSPGWGLARRAYAQQRH